MRPKIDSLFSRKARKRRGNNKKLRLFVVSSSDIIGFSNVPLLRSFQLKFIPISQLSIKHQAAGIIFLIKLMSSVIHRLG